MVEFLKGLRVNYTVSAVLCILLGLVLLIWPGTTTQIVCMSLGIVLLAYGIIQIVIYLYNRERTIISQNPFCPRNFFCGSMRFCAGVTKRTHRF